MRGRAVKSANRKKRPQRGAVALGIWLILFAIRLAVNAILLEPFSGLGISSIDVVAHHGSSAAISDGTLPPEPIRFPVLIELLGSVIEFAYERASNIVSITAQHSEQLPPTFTERWLTQPLRIIFGQAVAPRLLARNIGHQAIVFIVPQPRLDVASWCAYWTDDSNPDDFFDCYAQLLKMIALAGDFSGEAHPVTRFYDELAQVAKASRWVMALTLAGCTEGLAQLLRPKMNAGAFAEETEWSKQADDLAENIKKLDGPDPLKKKAIEAVLQTKGASTAGTLRALQKASPGSITPQQFLAWSDLRHRVMHGNFVSPYSNEKEDNQLFRLVDIVRALTRELINGN